MARPVFEHRIVAPADAIDELGHVNNAVWVQWIQEVALAHWYSVADPQHQDDYIWVVVRHEIDYLRARTNDRSQLLAAVRAAPPGSRLFTADPMGGVHIGGTRIRPAQRALPGPSN
jgi:acyl-CoA thioester hydrolase